MRYAVSASSALCTLAVMMIIGIPGAASAQMAVATPDDSDIGPGIAPPVPPPMDSVLPRTGFDAGTVDLRDQAYGGYGGSNSEAYGRRPAEPAGIWPASGWTILPQIGVAEAWTDNAGLGFGGSGSLGNVGSDFITEITPSITVERETQRYTVNLTYSPIGLIYADNSDYSQVEEFASGDILGVAVPDWFYVDLRGSVSQQSVFGSIGPYVSTVAPGDRETNTVVSISPYLSHQFGSHGTVEAGVSYTYSATDAPQDLPFGTLPPQFNGYNPYGPSYLGTSRVFASYTTGEDLGRLRNKVGVDASFYEGSEELRNAKRILATDDVSYAINRRFALLGEIGYEDLQYPTADFSYEGIIGAGGFRFTPRRDSEITVEYRYLDGFGSAYVEASMQVTPRIRVYGGYSEGITTFQQDQQNQLISGNEDAYGVPDTAAVAVPLLTYSSAFGGNQQVERLRRLDATAVWTDSRDVVTLSGQYEHTTPVGRSVYGEYSSDGIYLSLAASRSLSPQWSIDGFIQYGSNRIAFPGAVTTDSITVSAGVTRIFSPSLSAYLRFTGTYTLNNQDNLGYYYGNYGNQNTITVGVLKKFY